MDDISGDLTNSCPINERNMYIIYCYYLINNPLCIYHLYLKTARHKYI